MINSTCEASATATSIHDQRFLAYVKISLRRHAARWKQAWQARSCRELFILSAPVCDEEGEKIEAANFLVPSSPAAEDEYLATVALDELVDSHALYEALRQLTERQRYILLKSILKEERQQHIATELQVTQQAVQRSKAQALRRLRSAIEPREVTIRGGPPSSHWQLRFPNGGQCVPSRPAGGQT